MANEPRLPPKPKITLRQRLDALKRLFGIPAREVRNISEPIPTTVPPPTYETVSFDHATPPAEPAAKRVWQLQTWWDEQSKAHTQGFGIGAILILFFGLYVACFFTIHTNLVGIGLWILAILVCVFAIASTTYFFNKRDTRIVAYAFCSIFCVLIIVGASFPAQVSGVVQHLQVAEAPTIPTDLATVFVSSPDPTITPLQPRWQDLHDQVNSLWAFIDIGVGPESGARNNCGFPPMKADGRSTHAKEPIHRITDRPNPR